MDIVTDTVLKNENARGLAIIIHNDYENSQQYPALPGTAKDAEAMGHAFKHLRFATIELKNGTKAQIENIVKLVSSYKSYPNQYNCFAFVFSGHGGSNKTLVSSDEQLVDYEETIIKPLHPATSVLIACIPKLVFIDACRGSNSLSTKGQTEARSQIERFEVSVPANVFVAYSTMEGYKSYENKGHGGIWMQELAKELTISKKSICDIVAGVNETIQKYQQPQIWNSTVQINLSEQVVADGDDNDVEKDGPTASSRPDTGDEQVNRVLRKFPNLDADNTLTLKDLFLVRRAMINVSARWKEIALKFNIHPNTRMKIRTQYRRDADQCLTEVIVEWLKSAVHSWKEVICAIAARVGGDNPREAEIVAREYKDYRSLWKASPPTTDNVDDTPITNSLEVTQELVDLSPSKLVSVGLRLGLSYEQMELCQLEHSHDEKLTTMVDLLLSDKYVESFGEPSWWKIVIAVAAIDGGSDRALANKIALNHPKGIQPRSGIKEVSPKSPQDIPSPQRAAPEGPAILVKPLDAFKTRDFPGLVNDLTPLAHKWEILGVQLQFEYDEILNIRSKLALIPGAPLSYLQEMIGIWLNRQPPKYPSYPTLSMLIDALKCDAVAESNVAEKLANHQNR